MQSVNGGTHHMNVIDKDLSLKFGMHSVNGGTHHMNVINKDFSMLTGKPPTSLLAYK